METASRFAIAFVLNAAWQVPLVALAAAAGGRLLPSASARHRLFLAAIGLSLVVPAAGVLAGGASSRGAPANPRRPAETAMEATAGKGWLGATPVRLLTPAPGVAGGVVAVYVAFLALAAWRRGRAWWRTAALRRSAAGAPPPEAVRRVAEECRRCLCLGDVEVLLSTEVASPVTLGARRPLILLPEALALSLGRDHLMAALGHEMAHVRRRDFAWNAAAELASWPVAFHPAAAWLRLRLRQQRELACDALVADRVLEPRAYARSLAELARVLAPAPALTLGVADAGILEERVMSLVTGRSRRKAGVFASVAAASLLVTASALAATYAVAIGAGPDGAAAILGSWSGRFDDRNAAPAVDLTVVGKQGGLSGRVTFYEVDLQGGRVRGKDEVEMLEPRFDGRRLTFKVKNPDGEKLSMALRLTGNGEGDLIARRAIADGEPEKESHELVIKMKRVK
jgi:Zn-dependent protease with chaperone function